MFGYVFPCKPELKVRDWNTYRAYYCGLCKELGREYGFAARMFLNYDMVFLAMLADGLALQNDSYSMQRCIANPLEKRPICNQTTGLSFAADALVLTAYYKLLDDLADESFFKKLSKMALRPTLGRMRKKAATRYPHIDALFANQTIAQQLLEKKQSINVDEAAEPTAQMTSALLKQIATDESQNAMLVRFGLCLGKILYYLDAAEDYHKDAKTATYNVFLLQGISYEDAIESAQTLCRICASEMAVCYNTLNIQMHRDILDNILFLGLPQCIANIKNRSHQKDTFA